MAYDKKKSIKLLQKMKEGGTPIDIVELLENRYGKEVKLPKRTFGGRTDGSRTYSG